MNNNDVIFLGRSKRLMIEFRDANGNLSNVSSPRIDIYTPLGAPLVSTAAFNISTGVYYYDFSLSTADSTLEGYYQLFWSGDLNGIPINQDQPKYLYATKLGYSVELAGEIIDDIRKLIGDDDSKNFKIKTQDIHQYLSSGVDFIQKTYPMGYVLTITPTSLSFNKPLTSLASELFMRGTALIILEHLCHKGLWGAGSISFGDVNINLTNINRERRTAVSEMKREIKESIRNLYMRSISGGSIDSYSHGIEETGISIRRLL